MEYLMKFGIALVACMALYLPYYLRQRSKNSTAAPSEK